MRLEILLKQWPVFLSIIGLALLLDVYLIFRYFRHRGESIFELLSRIIGSNFFILYIGYRIVLRITYYSKYPQYFTLFSWVNWGLMIVLFLIFSLSFVIRSAPRSSASRPREIIFPFYCALLAVGVYESTSWAQNSWIGHQTLLAEIIKPFYTKLPEYLNVISTVFVFIGNSICVAGLAYLKRSFSIMTEARNFVRKGPYRFIRHPLYIGESIAIIGFCMINLSRFNIFLTVLFLVSQRLRAYFEELKLQSVFPEYVAYKKETGAYFPKLLK
jgi:protein-S-isoprenylcysteine O-methyltransferase Ste14